MIKIKKGGDLNIDVISSTEQRVQSTMDKLTDKLSKVHLSGKIKSKSKSKSKSNDTDNTNKKTKHTDEIWKHIFKECKLKYSEVKQLITSKQIKNCKQNWKGKKSQFEPRLLCKMDNSNSRPKIFKDNNLYLIAVKNGVYAIIKTNIYIPLSKYISVPKKIVNKVNNIVSGGEQLLNIGDSETNMLDTLKYNSIFDEIIGEPIKMGPILGGRHRCTFNTIIGGKKCSIQGVQYETDGCYITDNYICIIEAKSKSFTDFNIRQLYYPYREIIKKNRTNKKIIALFIYKDKSKIIHIYKYKWNNNNIMTDVINTGYYQYC
jgi:hypothetical protein